MSDKTNEGMARFTAAGETNGIFHALHPNSPNCPKCGSTPDKHRVENHDLSFHDGDVVCTVCGAKVRDFDAG